MEFVSMNLIVNHQINQNATYHRHLYTNGSICDLTAKPRTAEARFTCGRRSSPEIVSVDELESCTYLLIIEVPSLCSHPTFVVSKSRKIEEVLCGAVPDSTAVLSDGKQLSGFLTL